MDVAPFQAARWLRNAHAQTLWPTLTRRFSTAPYRFERLTLPDHDFVDLAWTTGAAESPLLIVLHGLEGSLHSPYIGGILQAMTQHGWRAVLMHFRGCSGAVNRLARGYHSGDTGDLDFLVKTLRQREPNTPFAALGYSMGGNVLLKWLGEQGQAAPLQGAVAVSVPYELDRIARHLEHSLGGFYQWWLLRSLKANYRRKFDTDTGPVPLSALKHLTTFRRFDDRVTAPLHGFNGVDDYYTQASSRRLLAAIQVPTLLLHAYDDPFIPPESLPDPHELSPQVQLALSQHGGHVGFISGRWPWQPVYWLEQRIPAYLQSLA